MNPLKAEARIKTIEAKKLKSLLVATALQESRVTAELQHAWALPAPDDDPEAPIISTTTTTSNNRNDEADNLDATELAQAPTQVTPADDDTDTPAPHQIHEQERESPTKRGNTTTVPSDDDSNDANRCDQCGTQQSWFSCWECSTVKCIQCTPHLQCPTCTSFICGTCDTQHRDTCADTLPDHDDPNAHRTRDHNDDDHDDKGPIDEAAVSVEQGTNLSPLCSAPIIHSTKDKAEDDDLWDDSDGDKPCTPERHHSDSESADAAESREFWETLDDIEEDIFGDKHDTDDRHWQPPHHDGGKKHDDPAAPGTGIFDTPQSGGAFARVTERIQ